MANELNQLREVQTQVPGIVPGLWYDADGNLAREYGFIPADMNCDGLANFNDVNAFVLACSGRAAYEAQYPYCNWLSGDCNGNGTVNTNDTNCFIAIISQPDSGVVREYTWDGENRLIKVEPKGAAVVDGAPKAEYVYDYLGRRVQKKVWTYSGGGWGSTPQIRHYVWDGWRLVLEMDGSGTILRKFTWGLDLAGQSGSVGILPASLEAAGTIGGLLAVQDVSEEGTPTYFYLYDANGNVGQLVDSAGTLVAKYEYDPYGNVTAHTGSYEATNVWRFSTKQFDAETGLGYWGYRYYSPQAVLGGVLGPFVRLRKRVLRTLRRILSFQAALPHADRYANVRRDLQESG